MQTNTNTYYGLAIERLTTGAVTWYGTKGAAASAFSKAAAEAATVEAKNRQNDTDQLLSEISMFSFEIPNSGTISQIDAEAKSLMLSREYKLLAGHNRGACILEAA